MASASTLKLIITADNKASAKLKALEKEIGGIGGSIIKNHKAIGGSLTAIGAAFTGFAAMSVSTAAEYSQSMAKVKAVTGASEDQFKALNDQAKELGKTTQFTASEVASAMSFMGMAGMKTNDIMESLPDTLNLAAAGALDMGSAANIVTNILAGFQMGTDDLGRAVDVLAKAFTSSNVDLEMLGDSMKYAGPVAQGFGMAFEETAAIMGIFGNAGIQASMAGTSLRGAIARLSEKADSFGITMYDSAGKMLPMADILEQLEKKGFTAAQMMDLFGDRAGPAMTALLQNGSAKLREYTAALEDSGGTAEQIAKTQMEGLHGVLITLKSAFEGLQLELADALMPILIPLLETVTSAIRIFADLPAPIKAAGIAFGALSAAIGPLLLFLPQIITYGPMVGAAFTSMLGPIGMVAAAVGVATAAFSLFGKKAKDSDDEVKDMTESYKKATEQFQAMNSAINQGTQLAEDQIKEFYIMAGASAQAATEAGNYQEATDILEKAIDTLGNSTGETAGHISNLERILESTKRKTVDASEATNYLTGTERDLEAEIESTKNSLAAHEKALGTGKNELERYTKQTQAAKDMVASLESAITDANNEILRLSGVDLTGTDKYADQLFDIDMALKQMELDRLRGLMDPDEADAQIDALQNQRREIELLRDLDLEPQRRQLQDLAAEYTNTGVNAEMSFEAIKAKIQDLYNNTIPELKTQLDLAEQQETISQQWKDIHQAAVDQMQGMVDDLKDNQLPMLEAEFEGTKQILIDQANAAATAWANVLALKAAADGGSAVPSMGATITIPGFATGGMVPGPVGAPRLAVVHGGELVSTPAQQMNGTGTEVHVHVGTLMGDEASARRLAREVLSIVREENSKRTHGRLA